MPVGRGQGSVDDHASEEQDLEELDEGVRPHRLRD